MKYKTYTDPKIEKEFNLSEKITGCTMFPDCNHECADIPFKDVKEFIQKLKEYFELREMKTISITPTEIFKTINKLVGDKLI